MIQKNQSLIKNDDTISIKKQILSTYEMSMTANWSQTPMKICELHMTFKKQ